MKRNFTLLHITSMALTLTVSLVGCSKVNYQANEQERINAVSFKDTDYLQMHVDGSDIGQHTILDFDFSPNIYHTINQHKNGDIESYEESYVLKNGADYVMYSRSSPTQTTWDESSTSSEYFLTIEEQGIIMLDYYNAPIQAGATYQFDKSEKCYRASFDALRYSWYFANKKLIKFNVDVDFVSTFSYKKITPTPPVSRNHL